MTDTGVTTERVNDPQLLRETWDTHMKVNPVALPLGPYAGKERAHSVDGPAVAAFTTWTMPLIEKSKKCKSSRFELRDMLLAAIATWGRARIMGDSKSSESDFALFVAKRLMTVLDHTRRIRASRSFRQATRHMHKGGKEYKALEARGVECWRNSWSSLNMFLLCLSSCSMMFLV